MRKIYIVPNFVTTLNMFFGFYSIVASTQSDFVMASWAIMIAAVFDMLDGRIARLAKATSQFGVEYDSLSDVISFGMAPGILLYLWALEPYGRLGWLAAFLFTACGALRLARFNVMTGVVSKAYFQGLPIPLAAGAIATFIIFSNAVGWVEDAKIKLADSIAISGNEWLRPVILGLTLGIASLMVSTIKFPSFKELNWKSRTTFGYLVVGVLAMILIAVKPEVTLFLLLGTYIALSLAWNLVTLGRPQKAKVGSQAPHATTHPPQG